MGNDLDDILNEKLNEILGIKKQDANTEPVANVVNTTNTSSNTSVTTPARPPIAPIINLPVIPAPAKPANTDIAADHQFARENMMDLITVGHAAIQHLMVIAATGQQPRAYEVLNQLLRNMAQTNEDLIRLRIHRKHAEGLTATDPHKSVQVDKAAIFVGSTSELQKIMAPTKRLGDDDTANTEPEIVEGEFTEASPTANN